MKDYITRNPTLTVETVKEPPKAPADLDPVEVEALFDALNFRGESVVRDLAILQALAHGLRASEVSELDIGDYDGRRFDVTECEVGGATARCRLKPEAVAASR